MIKGTNRQEKIIVAWADMLHREIENLGLEEADGFIRESIIRAENITESDLQEMDLKDLTDLSKSKFVGTVISILSRVVAEKYSIGSEEGLHRNLISIYQQFPDHSG